ncbi:hypothetical protein CONPUDRAFT_61509, partial [Coniophora puteana RWD-64-598 SS2]
MHFDELDGIFAEGVPTRNVFNLDELGIQLGGGRKGNRSIYFFGVKDTSKYRAQGSNLELVTVLETICADGTAPIKPCFVFQGPGHCPEWYEVDDLISCATSENGWTNNSLCQEWFEKSFIPQAKAHADPTKPIVLI